MNQPIIAQKIGRVLKKICAPRDRIHVLELGPGFEGDEEYIHVIIVSRKLAKMHARKRHELVWSELSRELAPEEWGKITLTKVVTPEEVNGRALETL